MSHAADAATEISELYTFNTEKSNENIIIHIFDSLLVKEVRF